MPDPFELRGIRRQHTRIGGILASLIEFVGVRPILELNTQKGSDGKTYDH
jgi:hypothetical protein